MSLFDAVAVIGFSFGTGNSNHKLAKLIEEICDDLSLEHDICYTVAQWEIARQMEASDGNSADYSVELPTGRQHTSTKHVLDEALEYLQRDDKDVYKLILVAHPLHLQFIKLFIKLGVWKIDKGLETIEYRTSASIGYDKSKNNLQWWTKGPVKFISYLATVPFRGHGK